MKAQKGICPECSKRTDRQLLFRLATSSLIKAAGRKAYFSAVWRKKADGLKGRLNEYRITRRVYCHIYLMWDALGGYPPRGSSQRIKIGEFLKLYEVVK